MVSASRVLSKVSLGRVVSHVRGVESRVISVLARVIRANPGMSDGHILNHSDVINVIVESLHEAHQGVISELRALHTAAGLVGLQMARSEFDESGYSFPDFTFVPSDDYLSSILSDIDTMFTEALIDIRQSLSDAFLDIDSTGTLPVDRLRVIDGRIAVNLAVRRLSARAQASTVVLETRSRSEAQLAAYRSFEAQNPTLEVSKEWEATSAKPCPACAALHGARISIDAEFDSQATTLVSFNLPRVYINLLSPPRHVRCRCKLKLIIGYSEKSDTDFKEIFPNQQLHLTAEDVRAMSSSKYRTLLSFIKATFNRIRRWVRRNRR